MIWWQWFMTIGFPILAVGIGWLLGKVLKAKYLKITPEPLFKSRRTPYAKSGFKTITFEKFLELYYINPKKWTWDDTYYHYWETKKNGVFYVFEDKIDHLFPDRTQLYWETEKDKRLFNKWIKEIGEKEFKDKETSDYKRVLEDVQKDVKIKMDAIQKEHEAELARIEKERKKNQSEYERLMNEVANLAHSVAIPASELSQSQITYTTAYNSNGDKYITQTTTTPQSNKVYIDRAKKPYLYDNDYRLMYEGQVCDYFETDCGIPYIHTPDGKFLEVVFE